MADVIVTYPQACERHIAGEDILSGEAIIIRDNLAYKAPISFSNGGAIGAFALNIVKSGEMLVHTPYDEITVSAEESQAVFRFMVDQNSRPSDFGNG
jgi:hypothetical protein